MKLICNAVLILCTLLVIAGNVIAGPPAAAIENWAYNYPDAAFDLLSWAKENPKTAQKLSLWNETSYDRSRILVSWAISHPGKSIEVFMGFHRTWTDFANLIKNHRSATKGLIVWCRQYPGAAKALMKLSRQTQSGKNRVISAE